MKRSAAVAMALLLVTVPVSAQTFGGARFGVAFGGTLPVGDLGDANDAGYHFGVHLTTPAFLLPASLRFEIVHNRMAHKASDANTLITSGTVNAVFSGDAAAGTPMVFYGLAGAGIYFVKTVLLGTAPGTTRYDDVTRFGLNGGAGAKFPLGGFDAFAEARLHWVSMDRDDFGASSAVYVPLSFGITF